MASQISIDCLSWVSMIFIWMVKEKSQNHHWSICKIFVIRKNAKKTYLIWSRRQLAHRKLLILFHKVSSLKQSSHFQLKHKKYLIICSPNLALQLLTNWEKEQNKLFTWQRITSRTIDNHSTMNKPFRLQHPYGW